MVYNKQMAYITYIGVCVINLLFTLAMYKHSEQVYYTTPSRKTQGKTGRIFCAFFRKVGRIMSKKKIAAPYAPEVLSNIVDLYIRVSTTEQAEEGYSVGEQ